MKRKSRNTIATPTGYDLAPSAPVGVCEPTVATISIQHAIPEAKLVIRIHRGCLQERLTGTTDNEQDFSSPSLNNPGHVETEQDGECGVEGVDEGDSGRIIEDTLVDLCRVCREGALAGKLLTSIHTKRK